ncbi:Uu.00g037420.m01.CDS01 [Anthostomella pinea]|uniref:Uu.00g037420.m01.CDS01 n=1 Tax=Anthostomella pinea TaxID=933095 RepID=A0AAI8V9H8_9PEZI|nr:Uu.00g037420.m01.CDS01 [Anthostomella pinea]
MDAGRDFNAVGYGEHSHKVGMAFVFTGQGAQYRHMAMELMGHAGFEASIKLFDQAIAALGATWSVADKLSAEGYTEIDDPEFSHPMTTALQIALYELVQDTNLSPTVVVGHSSGEIAAAYAAGALSFHSACKVSYFRGKCASALKKSTKTAGAMMSVDLSEDETRDFICKHPQYEGGIHLGCVNSPYNVTLSGDEGEIDSIQSRLDAVGIRTRKLNTGVAYHSQHMNAVSTQYRDSIGNLERGAKLGRQPYMVSSVTGKLVQNLDKVCVPDYWVTNMVSPVAFSKAMLHIFHTMCKKLPRKLGGLKVDCIQDIIEIGPHAALRRPITECIRHSMPSSGLRYHTVLERGSDATRTTLRLFGEAFALGYDVDVPTIINMREPLGKPHLPVELPPYPFNHTRQYWHESAVSRHSRLRKAPKHELLGTPVPDWYPLQPRWRKFFDLTETPWVDHHTVNGRTIYPATGMVAMAIEGSTQTADPHRRTSQYLIRDAVFPAPITVGEQGVSEVQLHMRPHPQSDNSSSSFDYSIISISHGQWMTNCHGTIEVNYEREASPAEHSQSLYYREQYQEALRACNQKVPTRDMYENFEANGLGYGDAFLVIDDLAWDGAHRAVGKLHCFKWAPEHSQHGRQQHVAHPTTMDGAGQLIWCMGGSLGVSYPETTHLLAACTTSLKGLRGTDSTIYALDPGGDLKLIMSHLETTSIEGNEVQSVDNAPRQISYRMSYQPDLDLMTGHQQTALIDVSLQCDAEPVAFYADLELANLYFVSMALNAQETERTPAANMKPHIARYVSWLRRQLDKYRTGELRHRQPDWVARIEDTSAMEELIHRIDTTNDEGQLFVRIGRHLGPIIQGQTDPLELMFRYGHSERFYQSACDKIMERIQLEK